jgi:hypothetical protein
MRRKLISAFAVIAALAVVLAGFGATASTTSDENYFVSRINAERTGRGIRALTVASDLVQVARAWSAQMASDGAISHDPNLPYEVNNWSMLGDNVGRGSTASDIQTAFMNSPSHRDNILESRFTHVGVGVVDGGDRIYVTEVFVRRVSTTTTTHRSVRRTITKTVPSAPARIASEIDVTGIVSEVSVGSRPVTVAVLEELVGLDAPVSSAGSAGS